MGFSEKIIGLYQRAEDKWYASLDVIDEKVPIYPIVDKIDAIFPSFLLAIIIVFVILIGLVLLCMPTSYEFEAVVLVSSSGIPVSGVDITLSAMCFDGDFSEGITDDSGEAVLTVCNDGEYEVTAFKSGFTPFSGTVKMGEGQTIRISLLANDIETREIYAKVVDESGKEIDGVTLEMVCVSDLRTETVNGAGGEFTFNLMSDCSSIQLIASAEGYDSSLHSISGSESRIEITLTETVQNGSALFEVSSLSGPIEGVEITLVDETMKTYTYFTDEDGFGEFPDLSPQRYNYTVFDSETGESKQGIFEINPGETKEINISLKAAEEMTPAEQADLTKIFVKVVDELGFPIPYAQTKIFKGGVVFSTSKSTNVDGEISLVVGDDNIYSMTVKKIDYETKSVGLELKKSGESAQVITLRQGGGKIIVTITDEDDLRVNGAQVVLHLDGAEGFIDSKMTDSNGTVNFDSLAAGSYTIEATKSNSDGSIRTSLAQDKTKEVSMQMVLGEGKVGFQPKNESGQSVDVVNYTLFADEVNTESGFANIGAGASVRQKFETTNLKHGSKVKTEINDGNFFSFESLVYQVYKDTRSNYKPLLLLDEDLPNQTKVQMFLQEVYDTNPLAQGSPQKATKLEPGERYYLLFSVVLNPSFEETHDLLVNFVAGPEDKNMLIEHNPLTIDYAESVDGAITILSHTESGIEINFNDSSTLVNGTAKQGNVRVADATGPKQIPVLLIVDVDQNAEEESFTNIKYNAKWGTDQSLSYNHEFEIGRTFCLGLDCPLFLFSNYVKWGSSGGNYEVIGDERPDLFLGDSYTFKTIIENSSAEDLGTVQLLTLQNSTEQKILLDGNMSVINNFLIGPLETASPIEHDITTVDRATNLKIKQLVSKYQGSTDLLEDREGVENEFRIGVLSKDQLKIEIDPESIYAGAEYPMFTIRTTNDTLKEDIQAYWKVEKVGEDGLFNGMTGQTDQNGLAIIQFDASSLEPGDELIFTVYKSGFLDGKTGPVEVKRLLEEVVEELECLSVETEMISIAKDATGTFDIVSTCLESRNVFIHTDQFVSPKQFSVVAGATQTITVKGTARDGIIGAYPLQVLSINGARYSQIANVDIIVSDSSSCFSIDEPIFDLKSGVPVQATVTNNCFSGRKDNFHPKANISTNSVSFAYDKPGNPEVISLSVPVYGTAIESIVFGGVKSEGLYVYASGDPWYQNNSLSNERDVKAVEAIPAQALSSVVSEIEDLCEEYSYAGDVTNYPEPDLPEPEDEIIVVWDSSEIVGEEGSSSNIIEDFNSGDFSSPEKERVAKFEGGPGCMGYFCDYAPTENGESGELIMGMLDIAGQISDIIVESSGGAYTEADVEAAFAELGDESSEEGSTTNSALASSILNKYLNKGMNQPPKASGSKVVYMWDKWHDSFGNQTKATVEGDASVMEGIHPRGQAYEAGDEYWRWMGFGNLHDPTIAKYEVQSLDREEGGPIIQLGGFGDPPFGEGEGTGYFSIWAKADCDFWGCSSSNLKLQVDIGGIKQFFGDITETTTVDANIIPIEGRVYELGPYSAAQPIPRYMDIDEMYGDYEEGDSFVEGNNRFEAICIVPTGFINFEIARDRGHQWADSYSGMPLRWQIKDPADPFVEYSPDGFIMYWVPPWLKEYYAKQGLELYLRNGNVYAEYKGIPEIPGPDIGIEITNKNLLGTEYAIMTVTDWTGPNVETQAFQVKLEGPPSNCYHPDGTLGFTGEDFAPPLMFDWEWQHIARDQCDFDNSRHTYCDATQFSVELMKKINQIDGLYREDDQEDLGTVTAFYSYLIKDKYSQEFLNDFDEFYSGDLANADNWFNSAGSTTGFDKFISQNKIIFEGGDLPFGGLYQITLDVEREDESVNTILVGGNANATIKVKFIPVQEAQNYNPFYETPFDGEVGSNGRAGYGASVMGDEINLNQDVGSGNYAGSLVSVSNTTTESLGVLDNQFLLSFNDSTKELNFNPAQPTPVVMKITGTGNVNAVYSMLKTDAGGGISSANSPNKTWEMVGSTIGGSTCYDFTGSGKSIFTEQENVSGEKYISWSGTEDGTIELATTFFTPKGSAYRIQSESTSTTLNSVESLVNAETVELKLFDSRGINDYDALEGLFDMLKDEKVCMSVDSSDEMKIWWNPEYLDEEINRVDYTTPSCG